MENASLKTIWTDSVLRDHQYPEYPRPQLRRNEWLSLDGLYEYCITSLDTPEMKEPQGLICVPFPIESKLSGVEKSLMPDEKLWYKRSFDIPKEWKTNRIILHFGAVDWKAVVYVNSIKVLEHTGGYYPFEADITDYIKEDENTLIVEVWDPTDTYDQEKGKQVLNPGGMWYTPTSGIWQTVWLEPVPETHIRSLRITPDIDNNTCTIHINAEGLKGSTFVKASAYDCSQLVASIVFSPDKDCSLFIQTPNLWSPDDPYLYDLRVELLEGSQVIDKVESYFGMRKFSVGKDNKDIPRLMLNNKPIFMNGVLDQGFWPDGLYAAPCDEALVYDIGAVKKLGFNTIRKHIKVEPLRWYYHCDRIGIIVWQDMINGGSKLSNCTINLNGVKSAIGISLKDDNYDSYKALGRYYKTSRDNYVKELDELMDTLYNCVCIGLWTPFNESWGQFDAKKIAEYVKSKDGNRIVDHASGWFDQDGPDLYSTHVYFRKIKAPKQKQTLGRPWVVSEYGGYNLKIQEHVYNPEKQYGYKSHKTAQELSAAYTSLMKDEILPFIKEGLSGAIYTQLTDVEEETNGFLTYDRQVMKLDAEMVRNLNKEIQKEME
jgi:beta-galactosidase/beta-glucuronidase